MAKDKGKKAKADEPTKKSKGSSDDFAKPSDAPATGDGWKFETEDNVGKLFIINPLREQEFKSDDYGTSVIIVADIVEVNEKKPEKSELHEDVFVFGGFVKGSIRGYIGERKVLGRLAKGPNPKSKKKDAFSWVLEDADDDDIRTAKAYLATVDPFGNGGGKKSKK